MYIPDHVCTTRDRLPTLRKTRRMSMVEGKRRRRQSKKSKRSWRKHTDVEDVQEYLEDKQREELLG